MISLSHVLTVGRKLYFILADVIDQLYGSNIDTDPQLTMPIMLERTLVLEQKLADWRRNLVSPLQRRPWDLADTDSASLSNWDHVFDRLSVIITLRYLNTRILLHRPILSAFLLRRAHLWKGSAVLEDGNPFFHDLGQRSVQACEESAMEIVNIVQKTSKPPALLGAWWFSAYYSKQKPCHTHRYNH
jgi:hypothetical protein